MSYGSELQLGDDNQPKNFEEEGLFENIDLADSRDIDYNDFSEESLHTLSSDQLGEMNMKVGDELKEVQGKQNEVKIRGEGVETSITEKQIEIDGFNEEHPEYAVTEPGVLKTTAESKKTEEAHETETIEVGEKLSSEHIHQEPRPTMNILDPEGRTAGYDAERMTIDKVAKVSKENSQNQQVAESGEKVAEVVDERTA